AITRVFKLFIRIVPPVACCVLDAPAYPNKPPDTGRDGSGQAESRGRYRPACRLPQASLTLFCGWQIRAAKTRSPARAMTRKKTSLPMTDDEILAEFRAANALLHGHFLLSSGRHSEYYLQCARVLMDTERAGRLASALAAKLPRELRQAIDLVVSPAMGGVIIGHEMGRALGKPAIFVERPTGTFELRRGFAIEKGAKVLMVEDVVTT